MDGTSPTPGAEPRLTTADAFATQLPDIPADSLDKPLPPPPAVPERERQGNAFSLEEVDEEEEDEEEEEEEEEMGQQDVDRTDGVRRPSTTRSVSSDFLSPQSVSAQGTPFATPVARPVAERRSTAPETPSPAMAALGGKLATLAIQPRSRSPFSRTSSQQYRPSSSSSGALSPGFYRSPSLPLDPRPSSPLHRSTSPYSTSSTSSRRVSPLRRPFEDSYSFSGVDIDQTIAENSELELDYSSPRPVLSIDSSEVERCSTPTTPNSPFNPSSSTGHGTFPRSRRRPSSPLHVSLSSPGNYHHYHGHSRLHASASSPALRSPLPSPVDPAKYNESYPSPVTGGGVVANAAATANTGSNIDRPSMLHSTHSLHPPATAPASIPISSSSLSSGYPSSYSLSLSSASSISMPSTPSSFRSRSPSISSLETIPDSPDAEAAAIASADRDHDALARLRAFAEKRGDDGSLRILRGRTMGRASDGTNGTATGADGYGAGSGPSEKRKRWSVCGAEKRGDWEMETIWED